MIYDITVKMSKHRYPQPRSYEKSWLPVETKDPAACKKGWNTGTIEKAQIRMQRKFENCRALPIKGDIVLVSSLLLAADTTDARTLAELQISLHPRKQALLQTPHISKT